MHPDTRSVLARACALVLVLGSPALAQRGDRAGESQPDLPDSLVIPEAPALSPEEQLATFAMAEPGFTIELAAAEPMICAPVAAVFDEDGRLWVVEMQSYMPDIDGTDELVPTSRIVVLEDLDGDGIFDKDTVFLDGLILPRSVLPCYGGALVLAPPDLLFARDTDGDGRADETETLIGGFGGLENPEHAGNGLFYGLDNWIHFSQHGIEVRFEGKHLETRRTPGHGQWGITQDDQGRLYYCPNSDVLRMDLFPKHYAARNANQRGVRGMNQRVMHDLTVFPSRINPGVNRGYQPATLRDDFRLARTTAACSPVLYRSMAWGPAFYGNAFTSEPSGNCLIRTVMDEDASGVPSGRRAYADTEFLTSTDERFRPVATAVAPDGSLYVIDMYRGVIQHATYVTSFLRKQVLERELETPLHMGRIWRISKNDALRPPVSAMGSLADDGLVAMLAHTDAHFRDHARKLLIERRATSEADRLRAMAHDANLGPKARLGAMWTLEGLGEMTREDAEALARSDDAIVRTQGIRLLDPWADTDSVVALLTSSDATPDRASRLQGALTLGQSRHADATTDLARRLGEHGEDALVRSAIVSGLKGRETVVIGEMATIFRGAPATRGLRDAIAEVCDAALRASPAQRTRYLDLFTELLATDRWFAEIMLERLAANLRLDSDAPRTLELGEEPYAWSAALRDGLWDLHARALGVHARLRWPGHEGQTRIKALKGPNRDRYILGRSLYDTCAACHGFDGRGLQGQAPPLADSPLGTGPESRAIRVLLHGLEGEIEREGTVYDLQMPAAPFTEDEEVAALLTYIRRAFGNEADPVSPETVGAVRAETADRQGPWTEPELLLVD